MALNDLARVLLGVRHSQHIKVVDLVDRAGLPTVNEIVVRQSAIAAWKAVTQPKAALGDVLEELDQRTRRGNHGHRRPISRDCVAAKNMAIIWNTFPDLREAGSLAEARRVATSLGRALRHA